MRGMHTVRPPRARALLLAATVALSAIGCTAATPDGSLPCNPSIDVQRAAGFVF